MIFAYFTLFVALIISAVAEFYSIVGLTAIFAAQPIPVIIMGVALGVGKITAAVWLKLNWDRATWTYKLYLIPAVAFLMVLTSMGIFGFLSKAHSDQSLVSGDVQSKIAIYDEKIKTARENIEADRRQLKQMDEAVDQVMARSTTEEGASKSNQIRRAQARDRSALAKSIEANQKLIATLNDESAPIRAEIRKVEAEVGPIKYIAALIYGDNPDANLLERAVRWMIIMIVLVFDPLALVLILAAQQSLRWAKEDKDKNKEEEHPPYYVADVGEKPTQEEKISEEEFRREIENDPELNAFFANARATAQALDRGEPIPGALVVVQDEQDNVSVEKNINTNPSTPPATDPHPTGWMFSSSSVDTAADKPKKSRKSKKTVKVPEKEQIPVIEDTPVEPIEQLEVVAQEVKPSLPYYQDLYNGYVSVEGKQISMEALQGIYPDIWSEIQRKKVEEQLKPVADNLELSARQSHATFGTEFPKDPSKGELFLNVSSLPSRLFKFNGQRWIEVDKSLADSYTYNEDYLQYLVEKINQGLISLDDLTESEQDQIAEFLRKNA